MAFNLSNTYFDKAEPLTIEIIQKQLSAEIQTLLSLKANSITPDTAIEPLGMDSLKLVSLMIAIEQKFGVNLMKTGLKPDDLKSVRSLAAAIHCGQNA
jgi:acyl carrier protein